MLLNHGIARDDWWYLSQRDDIPEWFILENIETMDNSLLFSFKSLTEEILIIRLEEINFYMKILGYDNKNKRFTEKAMTDLQCENLDDFDLDQLNICLRRIGLQSYGWILRRCISVRNPDILNDIPWHILTYSNISSDFWEEVMKIGGKYDYLNLCIPQLTNNRGEPEMFVWSDVFRNKKTSFEFVLTHLQRRNDRGSLVMDDKYPTQFIIDNIDIFRMDGVKERKWTKDEWLILFERFGEQLWSDFFMNKYVNLDMVNEILELLDCEPKYKKMISYIDCKM